MSKHGKRHRGCDRDKTDNSSRPLTRSRMSSSSSQQGSVVDNGCSPSYLYQYVNNRDYLYQRVLDILCDRSISYFDKFPLVRNEFDQVLDKVVLEIPTLEEQYRSLREERSALQEDNDVLRKKVEEKSVEDQNPRSKLIRLDLNVEPEANEHSCDEVERGFPNRLEQLTADEILSNILSLTLELQRRSHEHESCMKLKPGEENGREQKISHKHESLVKLEEGHANGHDHEISHEHESGVQLEPGEANGHEQFNAVCGSYTDDSATPNLLHIAFSSTKAEVKRFQKMLSDAVNSRQNNRWDPQNIDHVFFARPRHVSYYVGSVVSNIFFKGFENESFNTSSGVSRFLDPDVRKAKFYEDYQQQKGADGIDDTQFEEFCKARVSRLFRKMFPECNGKNTKVSCFEELGGCQLALTFEAAARSVWLLHKLAFSFEPPVSIFRVERGADVDSNYMNTVVNLEDNERFVAKVGFMITPGFRLHKSVMPCEVYLLGATTTPKPSS